MSHGGDGIPKVLTVRTNGKNASEEALQRHRNHPGRGIRRTKTRSLPGTRSFSIHLPWESAERTFPPIVPKNSFVIDSETQVLSSTDHHLGTSSESPLKWKRQTEAEVIHGPFPLMSMTERALSSVMKLQRETEKPSFRFHAPLATRGVPPIRGCNFPARGRAWVGRGEAGRLS